MLDLLLVSTLATASCVSYNVHAVILHLFDKSVSGENCDVLVQSLPGNVKVTVPIDRFRSGSEYVDSKVVQMLSDENESPITITIGRDQKIPEEKGLINGLVTVRGVTLKMDFSVSKVSDRYYLAAHANFSAIQITPPSAGPMGLILSVKDEFDLSGWISIEEMRGLGLQK